MAHDLVADCGHGGRSIIFLLCAFRGWLHIWQRARGSSPHQDESNWVTFPHFLRYTVEIRGILLCGYRKVKCIIWQYMTFSNIQYDFDYYINEANGLSATFFTLLGALRLLADLTRHPNLDNTSGGTVQLIPAHNNSGHGFPIDFPWILTISH